MAAINFTFTPNEETGMVKIEVDWVDVFSPVKLDDNLMPICNKKTGEFERYEDDLDYKTIRMSEVFYQTKRFIYPDKENDELHIGEWILYTSDYDIETKTIFLTQTKDEFKRHIEYEIPVRYILEDRKFF